MASKMKREADGVMHSKPGSVDQQGEDSFPASDAPSYSPGAIGAPENRKTPGLHSGGGHKTPKGKGGHTAQKPGSR